LKPRPFLLAVIVTAGLIALGANSPDKPENPPAPPMEAETAAVWEHWRDLRDEAICSIGWIAGNAYGTTMWGVVANHYGEDGRYYKVLVGSAVPGADHWTEASLNVDRYRSCRDEGRTAGYDEEAQLSRAARVNQIVEEMNTLLADGL
jgi:hypothetical protein